MFDILKKLSFDKILGYSSIVLLVVTVYLYTVTLKQQVTIGNTKISLLKQKQEADRFREESKDLSTALDEITIAVNELANQAILDKQTLTEWMDKPPEIKYKYIYSKLPKIDYTKGDCNETRTLIEAIGTINYDDL